MALSAAQKRHFAECGYLPYGRVLSAAEIEELRQRGEDIAKGDMDHLPSRYIQLEAAFRGGGAETMYLGIEKEQQRLMTECEQPRGIFRFMLIRGREFAGRV